jgi:RNA polymerase sigma-70 factor (ECF subfamily)
MHLAIRDRASERGSTAVTATAGPGARWFEEQVVALLPELFGAAMRLTRNRADAEDLVADAVVRGWAKLHSLRDPAAFRGWMFRILTNTFVSTLRANAAWSQAERLDEELGEDAAFSLFERLHQPFLLWWSDPERQFLAQLLREDLARAIEALPEVYRVVVVLADVEGLAYAEIAAALAVPIGTVRSRLARGRAALQKSLWAHGVDAGLTGPRRSREPTNERTAQEP